MVGVACAEALHTAQGSSSSAHRDKPVAGAHVALFDGEQVRKVVVIFADFPINQKAGGSLVVVQPRLHQRDDFPTLEIASQDWTIKQIALHNSIGGVG